MNIVVKTGKRITLNAHFKYLRNSQTPGKVTGYLVDGLFPKFKFVVIKREDAYWTVLEASSGERISTWEKTRENAIRSAQKSLNSKGIDAVIQEIEAYIEKRGFVANPEYTPKIVNSEIAKNPTKSIDRSKRPTRKRQLFAKSKRKKSNTNTTSTPEPTTTTIKPPQKQSTMANTNALKKYNARVAELVAAGKSRADARKQVSKEVADAKLKAKTKQKAKVRARNTITSRETKELKARVTILEKQRAASCAVRKPRTKKAKTIVA